MSMKDLLVAALLSVFALSGCQSVKISPETEQATDERAASAVNEAEVRAIAREAYIYGYPVVEAYKTLYAQAVDQGGPNFKAPFNQIGNTANVFTPNDTAIITPNSDTPYSFVWMDLRAEPLVLTLPPIENKRYYSVQLIDLYTHNFAYLGTRTSGNQGGNYMIVGPDWSGEKPANVKAVIRSESSIAYAIYRTQLFNAKDLRRVRAIQNGYKVRTLSAFLGRPAPAPASPIDWPKPVADATDSLAFFRYLNFMLQFAPTVPSEQDVMARFAKIGVGRGLSFDKNSLSPEIQKSMAGGIADGKTQFVEFKKTQLDTGKLTSGDLFGTREHLKNNYMYRYAAAVLGIFGNSAEEAIYPGYFLDAAGKPLDAAATRYTLHFDKDKLPPANAFWSLTMYDGQSKLLVANPLNRYLINASMLGQLKRDGDGGLTLYVQKDSPGKDKASNWLPAPDGSFYTILRVYLPKQEMLSGQWRQPPMVVAE
ncbi:cell envelope protein [Cupriavidus sp. SHE]|jgi:hypothetical protein|uniref:DUF1254 domain-containing protein n=1 Tax=Cupriavidus metallidurans TaxID=119219 RepID=A0A482J2C5_9BURK|nr:MULTISPECIES: DUF1254 domain-containing protein [Cupriavidus]KWR85580.1 cell envelope protein [Cupriavidus sp. SHE]QBP13160.1 DUF1254 domain-containing protein [Cupriavidus metallidurans]